MWGNNLGQPSQPGSNVLTWVTRLTGHGFLFTRHSVFSVNVFSGHSLILRKLSERRDGGVVRLLVNGLFFLPHPGGLLHLPGVPSLRVNRP